MIDDVRRGRWSPSRRAATRAARSSRARAGRGRTRRRGWARSGVPVRFAARVGADGRGAPRGGAGGARRRRAPRGATPSAPTGSIVVLAHDRTMFTARGREREPVRRGSPGRSCSTASPGSTSRATRCSSRARATRCSDSCAAPGCRGRSTRPRPRGCATPTSSTWTAGAALCLANEDEAAVLGDALAGAYPEVVVKRGAAGATLLGGESVPAAPADVVDLTGAGDAFAAGFLAAQLRGEDRLALAVATAARAVAITGGRPGVASERAT